MIYTIDRETPDKGLKKTAPAVLDAIAERVRALGIPVKVAY
jgi:DNA-binding ferritin-like protein